MHFARKSNTGINASTPQVGPPRSSLPIQGGCYRGRLWAALLPTERQEGHANGTYPYMIACDLIEPRGTPGDVSGSRPTPGDR